MQLVQLPTLMPGMMFFSFRSSTRRVSLEDFWYSVSSNRICRATRKHCLPSGALWWTGAC